MAKPTIRFRGFDDEWEQRKLGDVIEKLTGGASIAPDDYVDVGYRTIPKGAVNSSGVADMSGCKNVSEDFFEKNISSKTSSGELVTSLRDLVPTAPNMGRIVRICGETEDFLMPQGVYSIIVKEKNSEDFLITYSNSPEYRKIIMAEKNGSTQVHIRNGEFLNIDIPLPSYEEQMKIGEHFKTLDHVITLHQRKCDETKKLKKKMFPQNGSKVPEIRFKGFTDEWEQRKFGELGSVAMCKRIFKEQTSPVGDIPFYKIGTFGAEPDAFISRELFEEYKEKFQYPKIGDMLISASGTIGRTVEYDGEEAYFQDSNIVWFKHDERVDNSFLKCIYGIIKWSGIEGSTIKRLYNDNFLKTEFYMPSVAEQEKVGEYFANLDHIITLHQHKCEELKKLKKFMLQNMFTQKNK